MAWLKQWGLNWLLILDKLANTALLGDPNETVSRRIARARDAGKAWAVTACAVLTGTFNVFLRIAGNPPRDHCAWSEADGSIGAEIWPWSSPAGVQKTVTVPAPMPTPATVD